MKYSHGAYQNEQIAAQAERLGMWSGRFAIPEKYRRGGLL
jgi:endonuclease YncB( thermonuclease family)